MNHLESNSGSDLASLDWLLTHHGAKKRTREMVVAALPLPPGSTVADIAAGPCLWTELIASKVGSAGKVVALDIDLGHLAFGHEKFKRTIHFPNVQIVAADFQHLPITDSSVDAVFFSNGFAYASDPDLALIEQKRVVRPGGAVIGRHWNNTLTIYHPVPPDLLLEVQLGVAKSLLLDSTGKPFNNYFGQRLYGLFKKIGFERITAETHAVQLTYPLAPEARAFLQAKAQWMQEKARPYMSKSSARRWRDLFEPTSSSRVLDREDFYFCTVEVQVVGIV